MNLTEKTVLITGANRGIGKAVAMQFAPGCARLILHARETNKLVPLSAQLQSAGCEVVCIGGDLSVPGSGREIMRQVMQYGGLDVLVNNAGIFRAGPVGMLSHDDLLTVFQINLFSVIELIQYGSRLMQRRGGGSIINIASVVGTYGRANASAYAASKAAIIGLTRSLAMELGPGGIRVNAVAPGIIDTDMACSADEKTRAEQIAKTSFGRMGHPKEVADVVVFLAGDGARYINGQIIGVDGGMTI